MFSKIDLYFSKKFIFSSLLVGVVFYALFFLVGLLENLDNNLPVGDYLLGVSLGTFAFFYGFLPTILLMAFLFAFGGMVSKREIVALQALGYPFRSLVLMVLKGTFFIFLIWGTLMEYAFPLAVNQSKKILSPVQSNENTTVSITGEWVRSEDFFINIVSTQDSKVFGVTIRQVNPQGQLLNQYYAAQGEWQNNTLSLQKITHTKYHYKNQALPQGLQHIRIERNTIKNKDFKLNLTFDTFSYSILEPNQMVLSQLLSYADYITKNHIDGGGAGKFIFSFWERVLMPLSIIGLILITMPTMLGTPRVQKLGDKIFIGVLIGVMYFIFTELARNSNSYLAIPHSIAAAILPCLLFFYGCFVYYRTK
jgi:lipopolysaccharide export system permease protein